VLDEKALRRPGFRDDVRVRLADGQEWALPKPRVKMGLMAGGDGGESVRFHVDFGTEYNRQLSEFYEATGLAYYLATLKLAAILMRANYAIADDDLYSLLVFDFSDSAPPEERETLATIQRLILGIAPKASGSGDDRL
jgi:hypothetical protein